jgi:hypothetical protein
MSVAIPAASDVDGVTIADGTGFSAPIVAGTAA